MKHTYLCIGGPFDGQRHTEHRNCFEVAEHNQSMFTPLGPEDDRPLATHFKRTTYWKERLGDCYVWAHESVRGSLLDRLIQHYKPRG